MHMKVHLGERIHKSSIGSVQAYASLNRTTEWNSLQGEHKVFPWFLVINVCNQGKTLCSPCMIVSKLYIYTKSRFRVANSVKQSQKIVPKCRQLTTILHYVTLQKNKDLKIYMFHYNTITRKPGGKQVIQYWLPAGDTVMRSEKERTDL